MNATFTADRAAEIMIHDAMSWQGRRRFFALSGAMLLSAFLLLLPATASAQNGPFGSLADTVGEDREQALTCLTTAIVYEAGVEPVEGQQAVAQVILNRARTSIFPSSVCGVVYQGSQRRTGCQFSFTCDGSLRRKLPDRLFQTARPIAQAALDGALPDRVGKALYYHAYYVSPRWAPQLDRVTRIGAHIFYKSPHEGGLMLASTTVPYAGALHRATGVSEPFLPWGLALPRPTSAVPAAHAAD